LLSGSIVTLLNRRPLVNRQLAWLEQAMHKIWNMNAYLKGNLIMLSALIDRFSFLPKSR
jgi:hypothetical protein